MYYAYIVLFIQNEFGNDWFKDLVLMYQVILTIIKLNNDDDNPLIKFHLIYMRKRNVWFCIYISQYSLIVQLYSTCNQNQNLTLLIYEIKNQN